MAGIEILKLLSPSAVDPDRMPGGGVPALTPSDVAAMLVGASDPVVWLAQSKYSLDEQSLKKLGIHVYVWATGLAANEQWKITRGRPVVRQMSHLAVVESVSPGICIKCCGTKFISGKVCPRCQGTGRKAISDCRRAELIGVDKSRFVRCWRDRYYRIYGYVQSLESQIGIIISKNSREDETISIYA